MGAVLCSDVWLKREVQMIVSVVVPCRNERGFIDAFLGEVLAQEVEDAELEILVADGRSVDGTRETIEDWSRRDRRVRLIDNPNLTTPHALNAAIASARGEVVLRMDVHTAYAPDYVASCLRALAATGADNVGGPARTRSKGYFQGANSIAYHSPFAVGGARFHDIDYEGPVDTVTYGCWRADVFDRIGLFDPELVRNQDDEFNLRLTRAGGHVWQDPWIRSWYYPRSSWTGLFRQYHQYGFWKVRVIQKHRLPASWRHLVPGAFLVFITLGSVGALFWEPARVALAAVVGLYVVCLTAASVIACHTRDRWKFLPVMPAVFAAYHLGYGSGFVRGVLHFVLLRRRASNGLARLTR